MIGIARQNISGPPAFAGMTAAQGRSAPGRKREFGAGWITRSAKILSLIDRRVRDAGLRPTRQRVALAHLLFAKGDRHLSAEELHEEALTAGVPVSLATVYNALHQFTDAGLLRILAVEGVEDLFRHQHVRPPPLLHRGREQDIRHRPRACSGNQPAGTAGRHGNRQCRHRGEAAAEAPPLTV